MGRLLQQQHILRRQLNPCSLLKQKKTPAARAGIHSQEQNTATFGIHPSEILLVRRPSIVERVVNELDRRQKAQSVDGIAQLGGGSDKLSGFGAFRHGGVIAPTPAVGQGLRCSARAAGLGSPPFAQPDNHE